MKILLISPWKTVWVHYMKKYFEAKGHTFQYMDKVMLNHLSQFDVVISGWANQYAQYLAGFPKLAKKYICFVRSYEYYHGLVKDIKFSAYDKVIFVNKHIMDKMNLPNAMLMNNAIDLERVPFIEHTKGRQVLLLANISFKKGIPLFLQIARKMPDYMFHIAGKIQDIRFSEYIEHAGLLNVKLIGYQTNIVKLFTDYQYIALTSPAEGNPNCIIEGMAAGLKPVLHRFMGWWGQFPESAFFDTIDEAETIIRSDEYDSKSYRQWVGKHYDMWEIFPRLEEVICVR